MTGDILPYVVGGLLVMGLIPSFIVVFVMMWMGKKREKIVKAVVIILVSTLIIGFVAIVIQSIDYGLRSGS